MLYADGYRRIRIVRLPPPPTRLRRAYAFVNNSGANDDDDDDDTSRFLHHGAGRDSFLSSRASHCARQNGRLGKCVSGGY